MKTLPAFSRIVSEAMKLKGLGLRELCRQAKLDPSFLSKVLMGKRNPPSDEETLRRIAEILETDAVGLLVAAGRIPSEWRSLTTNSELLRRVDALASSAVSRTPQPQPSKSFAAHTPATYTRKPFNEELL
ncbi:MAG: helix-turn-helix transcriptional regulator [Elusimicrobia bacterium]|nr:helix-turn-helix transcriptional regulator [Elusimicrobiota bacterium]